MGGRTNDRNGGDGSPGAQRTLAILETLSESGGEGRSAAELARALGLPANSTLRILDVLEERRYVERRDEDRRYRLTGRLLDLARPRQGDRSLAALAYEPLLALRDATGETAQFCVPSQDKCVILEQAASRQPVKVLGEVGFRVPLYSCAPGKAILAALPPGELDAYLRRVRLKRFTPTTLSTPAALRKALTADRAAGWSPDRSEGMEGIRCAGAAVLDRHRYPFAGVTVIGPAFRMPESLLPELGRRCRETAAEISRRMDA